MSNSVPASWNTVEKAVESYKAGRVREALSAVAKMRMRTMLTKGEHTTIQIAADILNGRESFYRQLGKNTDKIVEDAIAIFEKKVLK